MTDPVYAEPPDGSVIGWGKPIRACHVRIDDYVDQGDDPEERWFSVYDNDLDAPMSWPELLRLNSSVRGGGPYLLSPSPLKVVL